jgi:hypothetical protein
VAERCAVETKDRVCFLVEHPGFPVHIDITSGWPQVWSVPADGWKNRLAVPDDPLADAPPSLRRT